MELERVQVGENGLEAHLAERNAAGWRLIAVLIHTIDTTDGRPDYVLFWERQA